MQALMGHLATCTAPSRCHASTHGAFGYLRCSVRLPCRRTWAPSGWLAGAFGALGHLRRTLKVPCRRTWGSRSPALHPFLRGHDVLWHPSHIGEGATPLFMATTWRGNPSHTRKGATPFFTATALRGNPSHIGEGASLFLTVLVHTFHVGGWWPRPRHRSLLEHAAPGPHERRPTAAPRRAVSCAPAPGEAYLPSTVGLCGVQVVRQSTEEGRFAAPSLPAGVGPGAPLWPPVTPVGIICPPGQSTTSALVGGLGGLSWWLRQRTGMGTPLPPTPTWRSITTPTALPPCGTAACPTTPAPLHWRLCTAPVRPSLPASPWGCFFGGGGGKGGQQKPPSRFPVPNGGPAHGLHPRIVVAYIWADRGGYGVMGGGGGVGRGGGGGGRGRLRACYRIQKASAMEEVKALRLQLEAEKCQVRKLQRMHKDQVRSVALYGALGGLRLNCG